MPGKPKDFMLAGQKIVDLAHDLSNHLNSIVLQASCLLLKVEEKAKPEVELIRQEGIQAAALLRDLQNIGHGIRGEPAG